MTQKLHKNKSFENKSQIPYIHEEGYEYGISWSSTWEFDFKAFDWRGATAIHAMFEWKEVEEKNPKFARYSHFLLIQWRNLFAKESMILCWKEVKLMRTT